MLRDYAETTDADGQVITANSKDNEYQWMIIATTAEGRLAYLGFTGVWSGEYYDAQYNATKVYTITDRPVYRPGQKVQFKLWVRHAWRRACLRCSMALCRRRSITRNPIPPAPSR